MHSTDEINSVLSNILQLHPEAEYLNLFSACEQIELLGEGESNLNYLLSSARGLKLVLRLSKPDKPSTFEREAGVLHCINKLLEEKLLDRPVAPDVYHVESGATLLGAPFCLLSYVDGEIVNRWNDEQVFAHAQALASLHRASSACADGCFESLPSSFGGVPQNFLQSFESGVQSAKQEFPSFFQDKFVVDLTRLLGTFFRSRSDLTLPSSDYCLVHGDAHKHNVLFTSCDGLEQASFIDWEQSCWGDPARDLSHWAWEIETHWQQAKSVKALNKFLDAYYAHNPVGSREALEVRRDLCMLNTMYFDQLYHRSQIPWDRSGLQVDTVQRIQSYLKDRFSL